MWSDYNKRIKSTSASSEAGQWNAIQDVQFEKQLYTFNGLSDTKTKLNCRNMLHALVISQESLLALIWLATADCAR